MRIVNYLIFFAFYGLYAQVNFTDGNTLIDLTHYSSKISAVTSADLNNDGLKEIIVGSYYDNKIMFYKNIEGNIQHDQRQILIDKGSTTYYSDFDIQCADLDNDGLTDIIASQSGLKRVIWFKNLGNYNFDVERPIQISERPKALAVDDIDNDGDMDLIFGPGKDNTITLLLNDGSAKFDKELTIDDLGNRLAEIKLFDLDNNGFLDIISGLEDGRIYWTKNMDGSNFSPVEYITGSADDGIGFDFIDINDDTYYDIVFSSNYDNNLSYLLNLGGNSFSDEKVIIDGILSDPYNLITKDIDKDGLMDIIVSTTSQDKIGWYKNNGDESFSSLIKLTNNVFNPRYFVVEDLENDGTFEIITSSNMSSKSTDQKLSVFKYNTESDSYQESIISFKYGAVNAVKIADINNDGLNDIVSGFQSILWNENYGNGNFSSPYQISNTTGEFVTDMEIQDLNKDGLLDIISSVSGRLEIYKNIDGQKFDLVYNKTIDGEAGALELSDINGSGNLDILISNTRGEFPISKIVNNGNFDFQEIAPLYAYGSTSYKAYDFKCGDMDNDGDEDIVVGAKDFSEIHWLKNDGFGNFEYQFIISSIACDNIAIGDIDEDGDIDIVTSSSYSYDSKDLNWLKGNPEGFSSPIKIDSQSLKSITLGDINNDGYLDLVGTSYEYYRPYNEKTFFYLFENNSFSNQVIIEYLDQTQSLTRNLALGDLNNDNKLDIASSYYFIDTVKYFLNTSILSVEDIDSKEVKSFKIYPNPASEFIYWDKGLNINEVSVFNLTGKLVYHNDDTFYLDKLSLQSIDKGLYIVMAKSDLSKYVSKLVVK
jgi:hypothetical protein